MTITKSWDLSFRSPALLVSEIAHLWLMILNDLNKKEACQGHENKKTWGPDNAL